MSRGTRQPICVETCNGHDWDLAAAGRLPSDTTTTLLARYQATGDVALRNQVVQANLRLVAYVAGRFRGRGMSVDDLMSEGAAALLRAADTFDPTRGVSFGAYAATAITHSMRRALGTAHDLVAIPSQVRRRLSKNRRAKDSFFAIHGRQPAAGEIPAEARGGPPAALRLAQTPTRSCDASGAPELAAVTDTDALEVAFSEDLRAQVRAAVGSLDESTADVVRLRFGLDNGAPRSWRRVAEHLGISVSDAKSRMSQAMGVLRGRLSPEMEADAGSVRSQFPFEGMAA